MKQAIVKFETKEEADEYAKKVLVPGGRIKEFCAIVGCKASQSSLEAFRELNT